MFYEEYDNKPYTHEWTINGMEWYPCFIYEKQMGDEGQTTILTRNRSLIEVKNHELRELM